jgi:hypothetical protein
MRTLWVIVLIVPVLLGLVIFQYGYGGRGGAQALPTPVGQLGGPVPLTPEEPQQTSTPQPTPTEATPATAAGLAACDVAPISLDEAMARIVGVVESAGSVPNGNQSKSVGKVETTLRAFVACLNAGDYLRVGALTTPGFFAALIAGTGWPADQLPAKLSALHPRDPDLFLQIKSIGPAVDQSGGEVALTVTLVDPASPFLGETEYGARFVQDGSGWLLADLKIVG